MDVYRYALIGGIMFCALVLLTRWQAFTTVEQDSSGPISTLNSTANAMDGGEDFPEQNSGSNSTTTNSEFANLEADIPTAIPSSKDSVAAQAAVPNSGQQHSFIKVLTDTLDLQIDPLGGDIIYVALPQHKRTLEGSESFVLLNRNTSLTYVAQSGLIGPNATDTAAGRPLFESAGQEYRLADGEDSLEVVLSYTNPDSVRIDKVFTFSRSSYQVDLEYRVKNGGQSAWQAALFAQIKRDNSADPGSNSGGLGMVNYLGFATTTADEPYVKVSFDDIEDDTYRSEETGGWLAMVQHYFISAWIPPAEQRTVYSSARTQQGHNIFRLTGPLLNVAAGEQGILSARFYAGPKDQYVLEEISPGLDLTVDYGWLWWIAQPLFWVLTWLHGFIGNWGWSIVALTFLIKLAFFQLSASSYKSMAKMRVVAPKLAELKDRYGDDRQKYSQAMMELYKKEKINPLGSCLPMLIQMPVFIALYWVLMESVELRHSPFLGWIQDLSAMDPLFVLPLLMGASMWFMQKLNPPPPDPMQAKIFQWMPVVMTFLFLFFPAGLVLYWLTNNLLSIAQQWVITRQIEQASQKA